MKKNSNCLRLLLWGYLLFMVAILTACQSSVGKDDGAQHITLNADKKSNPNEKGQPSPVSVRIYELKSTEAFLMSDYFTIVDGSDAELLTQIKKVYESMMKPGEKRDVRLYPAVDSVALGIVVAYRDINHAQAIKVWPLKSNKTRTWYAPWRDDTPSLLQVNIEPLAISVKEVD
ncbi:type VI secretion system lipoprotein TssJ [Siccibacter colletis]|uniref:type VI secretion system lipoprotein TssJ n=1 Tax=Siccibacter colletis TaxID=1505757 RepID=UPI003CE90DD7